MQVLQRIQVIKQFTLYPHVLHAPILLAVCVQRIISVPPVPHSLHACILYACRCAASASAAALCSRVLAPCACLRHRSAGNVQPLPAQSCSPSLFGQHTCSTPACRMLATCLLWAGTSVPTCKLMRERLCNGGPGVSAQRHMFQCLHVACRVPARH